MRWARKTKKEESKGLEKSRYLVVNDGINNQFKR